MSSPSVRNRPPAITAAVASSGDVSPWATLHGDLVRLVGWRVLAGDLLDYVRLRAVCRYWRFSTVSPLGRGIIDPRFHPRRWMMLPEGHGLHPREDAKKRFFNLSSGVFVRPRLPLLKDHFVLCPADGLLLLLQGQQYHRCNSVRLLHPFTGDVVELPANIILPADMTLPEELRAHSIPPTDAFAAVSTSPDGVVGVMVAFKNTSFVVFASTREERWGFFAFGFYPHASPLSFKGELYMMQDQISAAGWELNILRFDPPWQEHSTVSGLAPSSLLSPKLVATCSAHIIHSPELVECDSEILIVGYRKVTEMIIYRLADLALGKIVPVNSIGGNALLFGTKGNPSFSLSAVPTITGDTIVVANCIPDKYILQYHLSSDTWSARVGGCAEHGCNMECTCSLINHMCNSCHCIFK
ncbi:hypothetical protein VPH35_041457 [Triticum aestivum]|uniref:uncharacterized protein n=1 Tax=Triticum aestivum TaxID=4565 RepID=UPI0008444F1F|nr:uncharacterized protein LOC123050774 [Triticum aestivum]